MILNTRIARRERRGIENARQDEARLFAGRPLDTDGIIRREARGTGLWALLAAWAAIAAAALWLAGGAA